MLPNYGLASYWDERFAADSDVVDWYLGYAQLKPLLQPYLRNEDIEIFIPGAGTSRLGADLYEEGYKNVTCADTSRVAVEQMASKFVAYDEMEYSVMDATDLSALPLGVFDLVVDKGLLDSVLCGERAYTRVTQMVGEMLKVLKPDGAFVVVSHGAPATRQAYLEGEGTSVEVHEVPKPTDETFTDVGAHSSFFVYVVTKK